ncbi:hypothetical protein U5801_24745 [Lamprobacter modestohalophilus]|uniref:hypothetical protein n=1 Tax=Lamprobacter modestohalophilus TaxID=1064514 RepID=UPI002ADEFB18|nr:hypothetical protein [Lamprobacter modestohalophilus]MEA1052991.1 hypothetical protein [Lamprobacter modestohalophilus]
MAAAERLRIQVGVCARRHPELFAILMRVSLRGRADRLRQLALLGLSGPSRSDAEPTLGTIASHREADARSPPESSIHSEPDPQLAADRARLLDALHLSD